MKMSRVCPQSGMSESMFWHGYGTGILKQRRRLLDTKLDRAAPKCIFLD